MFISEAVRQDGAFCDLDPGGLRGNEVVWYCVGCLTRFPGSRVRPETCPNGHAAEVQRDEVDAFYKKYAVA